MSSDFIFTPRAERGIGFGLHKNYRGKQDPNGRIRSKRAGSGLRKHLGDHITDTRFTSARGGGDDELSKRFADNAKLEEEKKKANYAPRGNKAA